VREVGSGTGVAGVVGIKVSSASGLG